MTASPTATEHPGRLVLRTDQQEGLANTVRHLRRPRTRGHAVSACGTGKTLFALRVAEELGVRHLAVAVPSLDLVAQWAAAARADGRREPMITVSSLRAASHPLLTEAEVDSANAGSTWPTGSPATPRRRSSSPTTRCPRSKRPNTPRSSPPPLRPADRGRSPPQ